MSRKKNKEYRDYLEDIYSDLQRIAEFTQDMVWDDFICDPKTQYAVCKALENMGEASKRIPESIRKKSPQIPFRQMAGLRDVVTHDYGGISYDMIWEVVTKELPRFKSALYDLIHENEKKQL